MFALDILGILFMIGLFFGVRNLVISVWRDSTLVDRWARSRRY